jgi:hypothetical protein
VYISVISSQSMRFQLLMVMSMKMDVFWVVAPCSLVEAYRRFRGACCLHRQDDEPLVNLHGATIQKTAIFNFQSMNISFHGGARSESGR